MTDAGAVERRPVLITIGIWLCWVGATLAGLTLLIAWFEVAPMPEGSRTVSGHEYLRQNGWVLVADALLAIAVALGARRRARWTRPLILAQWLLVPLAAWSADGTQSLGGSIATASLGIAFSWWYLYRKPNVRAFFAAPQ